MGFVTVNSKSLVVIPKAVRDKGNIYPGDKLKVSYDAENDSVVMKRIEDVKEISHSITGVWADNNFQFQEEREKSDDRIEKLLKNKLQQVSTVRH